MKYTQKINFYFYSLGKFFLNCCLSICIFLVTLLFSLFVLKGFAVLSGATIENAVSFEPRPKMWVKDPLVGYKNKSFCNYKAFGNVIGRTNDMGFRHKKKIPIKKVKGAIRIFGVGDSFMWGNSVNEEDTFLGVLQKLLRHRYGTRVEVINASVVGYSTYQELLFLKHYVVPFNPDIVLINFCSNDLLPSEDPFDTVHRVIINYLNRLLKSQEYQFSTLETKTIKKLIDICENAPHVRRSVRRMQRIDKTTDAVTKILLEIPILEMNYLAKDKNFRLIYLLISERPGLREFLEDHSIEYIDFPEITLKKEAERRDFCHRERGSIERDVKEGRARHSIFVYKLHNLLKHQRLLKILNIMSLGFLEPTKTLDDLIRLKAFVLRHAWYMTIDYWGHLSKKGHRVVAKRVFEYLFGVRDISN